MSISDKPDTIRANGLREKIKVRFLSGHLKTFPVHEKTLDIGCGWGFSLKINPDFYCVDADSQCIEFLQSMGAKAYMVDASQKLPFKDGFFDNAFTHDVCEHLEEQDMLSLFREARRVLKKGGVFMNVVPNKKGYDVGLDPKVGHKRYVQLHHIESAGMQTGFKLVKYWYTPLPQYLSEYFVHNKLVVVCRAV